MDAHLRSLFPPTVAVASADPRTDVGPAVPAEAALANRFGGHRRTHFLLGRACAHRALGALGAPADAISIDPDGAPQWPEGVVGSITHCASLVAAAAAPASTLEGIGLDAERRSRSGRKAIRRFVCTTAELEQLDRLEPTGSWDLIVFAAKEAIYKALSPAERKVIGFKDVAIDIETESGRYRVAPTASGTTWEDALLRIEGRYTVTDELVIVSAFIPAGA